MIKILNSLVTFCDLFYILLVLKTNKMAKKKVIKSFTLFQGFNFS